MGRCVVFESLHTWHVANRIYRTVQYYYMQLYVGCCGIIGMQNGDDSLTLRRNHFDRHTAMKRKTGGLSEIPKMRLIKERLPPIWAYFIRHGPPTQQDNT